MIGSKARDFRVSIRMTADDIYFHLIFIYGLLVGIPVFLFRLLNGRLKRI